MTPGHRHRLAAYYVEQATTLLEREANETREPEHYQLCVWARVLGGGLSVCLERQNVQPERTGALTADPLLTSAPTNEGE